MVKINNVFLLLWLSVIVFVSCQNTNEYLGTYEIISLDAFNVKDEAEMDCKLFNDADSNQSFNNLIALLALTNAQDEIFPISLELQEDCVILGSQDTTECKYELVNDNLLRIYSIKDNISIDIEKKEDKLSLKMGICSFALRKK